jgi:hypothetical protein
MNSRKKQLDVRKKQSNSYDSDPPSVANMIMMFFMLLIALVRIFTPGGKPLPLVLFETFITIGFLGGFISSIERSYCPICDQYFALRKRDSTRVYGETQIKEQITYRCRCCSHQHVHENVIENMGTPSIEYGWRDIE